MKKLAMSLITYNRAKHIKEDLDIIVQPTKDLDIDIYIYDGSTNVHTKYVINQFLKKGYKHIHYFHTEGAISQGRISNAFHQPEAEYVWLCGDKFIIKPEYYPQILSYIDKSYDIITIYGNPLNGTRKFNNPLKFVDYAIVPITHFGSTIIRKKLMETFSVAEYMNKNPSFGVQSIYLNAINNKIFKGVAIDGGKQVNIISCYETKSISLSFMWDSWVRDWYQFIHMLPTTYDGIKNRLYNKPDKQKGFFSMKELLRQRSEGQFDWRKYIKYRRYVKKVIMIPGIIIYWIAIMPKDLAKIFYEKYK